MPQKLLCVACLLTVSCAAHQRAGYVDDSGYRSEIYEYSVRALPEGNAIMGGDWRVDNFYRSGGGKSGKGKWRPKKGEGYETTYELDFDGDNQNDAKVETNLYDLRLTHAEHDGVVTLRMIPTSTDQGRKRLSVLVQRYVEAISGAGQTRLHLEESDTVVEKRYAAVVEHESKATVAGLDAYAATIRVKNLDQLRLTQDAPGARMEVVFAHMPFPYLREDQRGDDIEFPVIMMAVYRNRVAEFEEGLSDFRSFMNRIVVDGKSGATVDYEQGLSSEKSSADLSENVGRKEFEEGAGSVPQEIDEEPNSDASTEDPFPVQD